MKFSRNYSKCLTVSFLTQILILAIVPLSFISVCILCEFAMLLDVYILLSPQMYTCTSDVPQMEQMYTSVSTLIKKIKLLSIIILVCLGNTLKKTARHIASS